VQRVPETEAQGRIHTSACTVAVMPEADELDESHQSGRPAHRHLPRLGRRRPAHQQDRLGGAHHPPAHRHRRRMPGRPLAAPNKAQAMSVLAARINDAQEREQQHAKIASTRKSLIGSGDRSERIRTYNFPQGRVTDHRINLTLYKIDAIMDGDLNELVSTLTTEHQTELLAELAA
jgi:peptide chain release factor 1